MESLTEADKELAFQNGRISTLIPEGTIFRITQPFYESAIGIIRDVFTKDEPLFASIGVVWDQEQEDFWINILKENVSLIAIDDTNNRIMGLLLVETMGCFNVSLKNKDMNHIFSISKPSDEVKYMTDGDAIHLLGLTVMAEYRKRGIASKLVQASIRLAQQIKYANAIKIECSSNYSKRIVENIGFKCLQEKFYNTYFVDGDIFFKNTGEHKSVKIYEMAL